METILVVIGILIWAYYSTRKDQLEAELQKKQKEEQVDKEVNLVFDKLNGIKKKYPEMFDKTKFKKEEGNIEYVFTVKGVIGILFENFLIATRSSSELYFFEENFMIVTGFMSAPEHPICKIVGIPNEYNEIDNVNTIKVKYNQITRIDNCRTETKNIKDFYKSGIIIYIGNNWISLPESPDLEKILKSKLKGTKEKQEG